MGDAVAKWLACLTAAETMESGHAFNLAPEQNFKTLS